MIKVIHPEGDWSVFTKFHSNSSYSCGDISCWCSGKRRGITKVSRIRHITVHLCLMPIYPTVVIVCLLQNICSGIMFVGWLKAILLVWNNNFHLAPGNFATGISCYHQPRPANLMSFSAHIAESSPNQPIFVLFSLYYHRIRLSVQAMYFQLELNPPLPFLPSSPRQCRGRIKKPVEQPSVCWHLINAQVPLCC